MPSRRHRQVKKRKTKRVANLIDMDATRRAHANDSVGSQAVVMKDGRIVQDQARLNQSFRDIELVMRMTIEKRREKLEEMKSNLTPDWPTFVSGTKTGS